MSDDEFNADNFSKYRTQKQAAEQEAKKKALEGDPELQSIITETKQVQQDTVQSSRNAVKTMQETIVVADKTNANLKSQGDQLKRIGETAERADDNAQQSYDKARELHKYKGFLPFSIKQIFTGGKKHDADQDYIKKQKELDKEEAALQSGAERAAASSPLPGQASGPKKTYADDAEAEIDQNLDELSKGLSHLKGVGLDMQGELAQQKVDIDRINATTEHTDYTINSANRKIQEFM